MKSVLNGVWGNPHQAAGGSSSEFPPAVFWLQKTLLAKCNVSDAASYFVEFITPSNHPIQGGKTLEYLCFFVRMTQKF